MPTKLSKVDQTWPRVRLVTNKNGRTSYQVDTRLAGEGKRLFFDTKAEAQSVAEQEPLAALARDGFARSIIYAKDKPILRYNPVEAKFREMYLAAASTKAPDWEYEQEIRVFVPNSYQVLRPEYLLGIYATCIRNVFLGARASPATKAEARRLLGQASFAHTHLFQGQLSDAEYVLNFSPVP